MIEVLHKMHVAQVATTVFLIAYACAWVVYFILKSTRKTKTT